MNPLRQGAIRPAEQDSPGRVVNMALGDDVGKWVRIGIAVLVLGVGGFFVWAAMAPLDEGVPVPGVVTVDMKRKAVQHLTGGIVKKRHVQEAQLVKGGEVLIELDDTQARANFESLRQTYVALRASEGRLAAEQRGADRIAFHSDLNAGDNAPHAAQFIAAQQRLFESRRAALRGDVAILNESAAAQEESLKGLTAQLGNRRAQLRLLEEQLSGTRDLVKEGYLPRNTQLEQERSAAELDATLSDIQGNIQRTGRTIAELRLRAAQRRQEFLRDAEAQLADVKRDIASTYEKLVAAREDLRRVQIRAPVDGQVVGLSVFTEGGVIGAGQRLMDIVPIGEPLVLEAKVPPHLIDRVHVGLPADLNFHGFVNQPRLVVEGSVVSLSADLLTEPAASGQPESSYYLARVVVTPQGMKELEGHRMQPGMPADVIIKTGERSLLTYLLRPLLHRIAVALKEH